VPTVSPTQDRFRPAQRLPAFVLGLLLWAICAEGNAESWLIGLPAALLFAWVTPPRCASTPRLRLLAVPRFLVYFLLQSLRGAWDVAWRALSPAGHLQGGFARYVPRLPDGAPRALFANIISLLPGTLSWALEGDALDVHMLQASPDSLRELAELEREVGRLYGWVPPEAAT